MLLLVVRRDSDPFVIWHRVQMVQLSARGMDMYPIAEVAFAIQDQGPGHASQIHPRRGRVVAPALR